MRKDDNIFVPDNLSMEDLNKVQNDLKKMFNKPYNDTLIENKATIRSYMDYLTKNDIKIIVLMPPFPEIFRENIPENLLEELLTFIDDLSMEYKFDFWNLMDDSNFENRHFSDSSHLNMYGAEMMSEIINSRLEKF